MAIKTRTGPYSKFDPRKMIAGEWGTVTEGDPNAADGTAVYMCFTPGNVKRMTTYEDAVGIVEQAVGDVVDKHIDAQVAPTMEKCQKALTNMGSATQKADTATAAAKEATKNADTATAEANSAAESASKSAQECKELLDETHIQAINAAVKNALVTGDVEGEITGKTVSDLPEATTPADDNNMLIAAGNAIKKMTWGNLLTAIKNKILTWTYDKLSTENKTLPGAIEELNTKINKNVIVVNDVYTGIGEAHIYISPPDGNYMLLSANNGDWNACPISIVATSHQNGNSLVHFTDIVANGRSVRIITLWVQNDFVIRKQ